MPIAVACTSCPTKLKVADNLAGRAVKCPKCGTVVKVAGAAAPAPAAPAAKTSPKAAPPLPKPAPAKGLAPKVEDEEFDDNVKAAPGVSPSKAKAKAKAAPADDDEESDDNVKAAPGARTSSKGKGKKAASDDDDNVKSKGVGTGGTTEEVLEATDVPNDIKERVQDELSGKERLVWLGQPCPKIMMLRGLGLAVMGVIFAIVGLVMIFTMPKDMGAMRYLAGAVFALVGIGMCFNPLFQKLKARKMCYALTNKRCIVWTCNVIGVVSRTVYEPTELMNIRRADSWVMGDGAGDVIFKSVTRITTTHYRNRRGGYGGSSTSVTTTHYGFLAIRHAREVEMLIRETLVEPLVDKVERIKKKLEEEDEDED